MKLTKEQKIKLMENGLKQCSRCQIPGCFLNQWRQLYNTYTLVSAPRWTHRDRSSGNIRSRQGGQGNCRRTCSTGRTCNRRDQRPCYGSWAARCFHVLQFWGWSRSSWPYVSSPYRSQFMKSFLCGGLWAGPAQGVLPPSKISISGERIMDISPVAGTHSHLFVIPGFVDAHCHFCWSGLESLYLDLCGTASAKDLLDLVSSEIDSEGTGRILRGFGFDCSSWTNPVLPLLALSCIFSGHQNLQILF